MWDDKTTKAIMESVEHWEENENLLLDGVNGINLSTGVSDCALCGVAGYETISDSAKCNKNCPLGIRGISCLQENSPYKMFMANKTPENARNMVLALKSLFYPEPEKKEVFYDKGQRFTGGGFSLKGEAMLSNVMGRRMALIGLSGGFIGNRWADPVEVKDIHKITEEEFKKISSGGTFTLKENK